LVKTKINAANNTKKPTNARSLDHLFEKFENITLTSETAPNLRVRKRFGIVHGEATLTGTPHEKATILDRLRRKKKSVENNNIFKKVIEEANVELDMTAFTLCKENNLPIIVLNINDKNCLSDLIKYQNIGTLVS
jgi:uridylate kinase